MTESILVVIVTGRCQTAYYLLCFVETFVILKTKSEEMFEALCIRKDIECLRISEGDTKAADYEISLNSTKVIVEIKQLEKNDSDLKKEVIMKSGSVAGAVAPSKRVQKKISDAYPQIKASCEGIYPGLVVIYNNAGILNHLDSFTISKAMFGVFAISLYLDEKRTIQAGGQRYRGGRKVTKSTLRALSAVAVLTGTRLLGPELVVYHNPYAERPIPPDIMRLIADMQFKHAGPHEMSIDSWEPAVI